jgi:hypothetical protein
MGRAEDLFERIIEGGESVIDALIHDRVSEELFLDFKRSSDAGAGNSLSQNDRNNLSKAISGFGNSEGGVIVWGVECKDRADIGDVPEKKLPVELPTRFVSRLEGAVSGCTVPPHPGVRHIAIPSSSDAQKGFVATLIPSSHLAPHQTVVSSQYYMRAGSNFLPVPHAVLQGLFGRRPHAAIFHMFAVGPVDYMPKVGTPVGLTISASLVLTSNGPGLVQDMFITAELAGPGGESELTYGFQDAGNWSGSRAFGYRFSMISNASVRLAPGGMIQPLLLGYKLILPFKRSLHTIISYGHHLSATSRVEVLVPASQLQELFYAAASLRSVEAEAAIIAAVTGGAVKPPV